MSNLTELEDQLVGYKELIEHRDQAVRLHNHPDYKALIEKRFLVEECARYVHASADPKLSEEQRTDALAMAVAAGHLKRFLSVTIQMGNHAESQQADLEAALDEARAMEGNV